MFLCPLGLPVPWVALLRDWLVCSGCDVLWGHLFLFIYNIVGIHTGLDSYCFDRNPCILHIKKLLFWGIIFLEYESGPLDITIFGVQSLYQCCSRNIKSQRLLAKGTFYSEASELFLCQAFL